MFTRPDGLTDADVVGALADGWAVAVRNIEYAAVGFGSHHWHVIADDTRWFATVDDLDARRRDASEARAHAAARLSVALTVARSMRDSGLSYVVAPERTLAGGIVHPIGDRYVAALYKHVEGQAHRFGPYPTRVERLAVLDRVATIHGVDLAVSRGAQRDDFTIPGRDQLALSDPDAPWGHGPFASGARRLLGQHGVALALALARYDELVLDVAGRPGRFVLTHGEPHRANTIDTEQGVVLIDWDTALLAPPERDLWMLIGEDPQIADDYRERTGIAVDHVAVALYRLWWDLCEISLFIAEFRRPHRDTEDSRMAWDGLRRHLDPTRWIDVP